MSLRHGHNPSDLTFDSGVMRQHLLKSLDGTFFDPFPLSRVQEQRNKEPAVLEEVPVIFEYRMPWD